jgi:DNA-binding response OmpR family regulator
MALAFALDLTAEESGEELERSWLEETEMRGDGFRADPNVVDVLVVDDEESIRSSLAEILSGSGYTVATADDGITALPILRESKVAMVLLDLKMQKMGGADLLKLLDDPPPVVVLSAFSLDEDTQRKIGSKVSRQLKKPVDPRVLLEVVAATLGR